MDVKRGDRVLVNVAPFIGSMVRHRDAIACRVLAVDGGYVEVATEAPYRAVSLRVAPMWIEGPADRAEALVASAEESAP